MIERLGYFMGMEFGPGIIADLQKEYGGHPFFTRQVCSKIHQLSSANRPIRISSAALERAKSEFYGQLESYLRDIIEQLRQFYPSEFALLRAVASGNRSEISEYGNEAPDLIDHLIGYGFVERVGNEFDLRFDAIKIALKNVLGVSENSDNWAEISKRRNAIETDIRVALYHWSKNVDALTWSNIIGRSLTKKRIEALASFEPRILFAKHSSPLYMTDLIMIIRDAEAAPYLSDRKSTICSNLDVVNKLRKDAHANLVTEDEMVRIRAAFDYLEAEFSSP
jgi:hypothetical protein